MHVRATIGIMGEYGLWVVGKCVRVSERKYMHFILMKGMLNVRKVNEREN
jgi:hypothetical protein